MKTKENIRFTTFFKKALILFSLILVAFECLSQKFVKGQVFSKNEKIPLIGALITIKGTSESTITDLNGKYLISLPHSKKNTLVFSFIGYVKQEIKIENDSIINIELEEEKIRLEEVVVVGYGVVRKCAPTAAVSITSMDYVHEESNITIPAPGNPVNIIPGSLTAGELNDFTKWELWKDIDETDLKNFQNYWRIKPFGRYTVQLTNTLGKPVIDAEVKLKNKSSLIWSSHTDNTGKAELWACIFDSTQEIKKNYEIQVNYNEKEYVFSDIKPFNKGINIFQLKEPCLIPNQVDAVFVVDATSSMGDEIEYLKIELNNVIEQVKNKQKDILLRLGSVFYRDSGDEYVTKKSDFSENISKTVDFIKGQSANGGGDFPEAVDAAIEEALKMEWNETARARLLFLVLDAPPHYSPEIINHLNNLIQIATDKGIRIIPITGSGIDKSTEYLMRAIALATNGTYVFLTNHSGIGNPHIEPTTDKYDVEYLNQLLVRLFQEFTEAPSCKKNIVDSLKNDTITIINDLIPKKDTFENKKEELLKDTLTTEKLENLLSWKYFPNPCRGIVNIEIEGNSSMLFLADISGKILERFLLHEKKITLDISQYPDGIYLIKFTQGEKWVTGKIILTH